MPSRTLGTPGIMSGVNIMNGKPGQPPSWRPHNAMIHTLSYESGGQDIAFINAGATWAATGAASTNVGVGWMFTLGDYFLVQKVFWVNGSTVGTDTVDVAVYSEAGGASSRLVAGGGAVSSTINVVQEINCTDTLLAPGRYWCVHACSGTTALFFSGAPAAANLRAAGVAQMAAAASGGVLGTTWTPAAAAGTFIPLFGIAGRTQVA